MPVTSSRRDRRSRALPDRRPGRPERAARSSSGRARRLRARGRVRPPGLPAPRGDRRRPSRARCSVHDQRLPHGADARHRVLGPRARVARGGRPAAHAHALGQGGHGVRRHPRPTRPCACCTSPPELLAFIGAALEIDPIFRSDDPLGALNYMYFRPATSSAGTSTTPTSSSRCCCRRPRPAACSSSRRCCAARTTATTRACGRCSRGDREPGAHHVGRARHAGALPRSLEPAPRDAGRGRPRAHERRALLRRAPGQRLGSETYRLFYGRSTPRRPDARPRHARLIGRGAPPRGRCRAARAAWPRRRCGRCRAG